MAPGSDKFVLTNSWQGIAHQHVNNTAAAIESGNQHRARGLLADFADQLSLTAAGCQGQRIDQLALVHGDRVYLDPTIVLQYLER